MKNYNQAPLPFQGQKRKFLKYFKEALKAFPSDAVYVDLFGGSGLLSHTVKRVYPDARVIWNDFDNYVERLKNIPKTNQLLTDLRDILKDFPQELKKKSKITGEYRERILERLRAEKGFVDWVSISSSIGFSMNYKNSLREFERDSLYYSLRQNDFCAKGYLEGVERVQMDYKALFAEYSKMANVVFLIDPPYLSTDCKTYRSENYWELKDYLNVLECLQGTKYFYFTSDKSHLVELCEWFKNHYHVDNPFEGSQRIDIDVSQNYQAQYKDTMIFKK